MTPETADNASSTGSATSGPLRPATVVTGASRGIGLAIATRFAANGHDVLMIARREEPLAEAARTVRAGAGKAGASVSTLALDVTATDAGARIDAALAANGQHLDVLVNNAAIGLGGRFDRHTPRQIDDIIAVNVSALSRLTHHAIGVMRPQRHGAILNVASMGGYMPGPYQAAYYASKAYVISLTEAVAAEVAEDGIHVAVVVPGPIDTSFHASMGAQNALYRRLLPAIGPDAVAASVYRGYRLGRRMIAPGLLNAIFQPFARLVPHPIMVPIMAWMLKQR